MLKDGYWRGWSLESFSKSEMEEAIDGTWAVSFTVDRWGFEVMVARWQLTYVRKRIRKEAQQALLDDDKAVVY